MVLEPKTSLQKPQVNDLIFKELIKRGYALEGNTRVWDIADSKLWYLTPAQAQAYLDLQASESYKSTIGPKELSLIEKNLKPIIKKLGKNPLNIIDLGCKKKKKAVIFVEGLNQEGIKLRYCPIDISGYMVEKAIEKISKLNVEEVIDFEWNISDFENLENITPLLKKGEFKKNFFLLLGNTLGNFELHELLYEVRSGMKDGDLLLIGNGLNNEKIDEDVIKFCKENRLNNEFLVHIPLQLGLNKEDVSFDVRFTNSRIEFYYNILKDKTIKFQDKTVDFKEGDQLIVAIAYHFEKSVLMSFLKLYFKDVEMFVSEEKSYMLAVCEK